MILTIAPAAADDEDPPVMLSSMFALSDFFYVPDISHAVMTHHNDPGAGGYWYFEPRLPLEVRNRLKTYHGPRCTFSCGNVASASFAARSAHWGLGRHAVLMGSLAAFIFAASSPHEL